MTRNSPRRAHSKVGDGAAAGATAGERSLSRPRTCRASFHARSATIRNPALSVPPLKIGGFVLSRRTGQSGPLERSQARWLPAVYSPKIRDSSPAGHGARAALSALPSTPELARRPVPSHAPATIEPGRYSAVPRKKRDSGRMQTKNTKRSQSQNRTVRFGRAPGRFQPPADLRQWNTTPPVRRLRIAEKTKR